MKKSGIFEIIFALLFIALLYNAWNIKCSECHNETVYVNITHNVTLYKTRYIYVEDKTKLEYCNKQWVRYMNFYEKCLKELRTVNSSYHELKKSCYCAPCETQYRECIPFSVMCGNVIGSLHACKQKLQECCI